MPTQLTIPILRTGGAGRGRTGGRGTNREGGRGSNRREADGSPSRKRTAIDPNAINQQTYQPDATQRNERQPPIKAALNFLYGTTATLHKDYQSTVNKVGEHYCKAMAKYHRDRLTLDSMISGTTEDGEDIPSRIPKSADIKFQLVAGSPDIESNESFQQLLQESNAATQLFKQTQAKILIKKKKLDVDFARQDAQKSLAQGLLPLVDGHKVLYGSPDINSHLIVNTLLETNHQELLQPLQIEVQDFRALYQTVHGLTSLPDPAAHPVAQAAIVAQPPVAPTPPVLQERPPLLSPYSVDTLKATPHYDFDVTDEHIQQCWTPGVSATSFEEHTAAKARAVEQVRNDQETIADHEAATLAHHQALAHYQTQLQQHQTALQHYQQQLQQPPQEPAIPELAKLEKLVISTFITTITQYEHQVSNNDKALALKKLHKETFTTAATEATDMEIDTEPPTGQQQIKDLVAQMVQDQMKQVQKQIARSTGKKVTQALNQQSRTNNNNNNSHPKGNRRGLAKGGASKNKKKSPNQPSTGQRQSQPRGRSRSASRPRNNTRGGPGRGRTGARAGGRGRGTSGGRGRHSRGRSRSSSTSRRQNSSTRRSRSSRRSTRN